MKNRTILTMAMLIAAMMLATGVVAFSDASDADTVTGSDQDTVPTTVFVIGTEYDNVFIGYGKDPQAALDGMTSCSKEVDGVDKMFMSGTPTSWQGILIPFDAGSTAYLGVQAVPEDEGYGAEPVQSGSDIYLNKGETYDFYVATVAWARPLSDFTAPQGMQYYKDGEIEDSRWELWLSGTPTHAEEVAVTGEGLTIHVIDGVIVTSVTMDMDSDQIDVGETMHIDVTVRPYNATQTVVWESSDESIATVDSNGNVEGKSAGDVMISVKSTQNSNVSDYVWIRVTGGSTPSQPTVNSITISGSSSVQVNGTIELTADVTMSSGNYTGTYTWTSSDNTKATVSNSNTNKVMITGVSSTGNTPITITVKAGGVTQTKQITVISSSVPEPTIESIRITADTLSVTEGGTITLKAVAHLSDQTDVDYTGPIQWTAENSKVTIQNPTSNPCQVKGNTHGEVKITATAGEFSNFTYVNVNEQTKYNYYTYTWIFTSSNAGYYEQLSTGNTSGNVVLPTLDSSQIPSTYTFKGWAKYSQQQSFSTIQTNSDVVPNETTISSNSYFYAVYTPKSDPAQTYTITVKVDMNGGGTVRVSGNGIFRQGEQATITAEASNGYKFSTWDDGGANATSATRVITVTKNVQMKQITVRFVGVLLIRPNAQIVVL